MNETAPTTIDVTSTITPAPQTSLVPGRVHAAQRQYRMDGGKVREASRLMEDRHRDDFLWFDQYCRKIDADKDTLGKLLKKPEGGYYTHDSVIQLLSGGRARRGENVDGLMSAIANLRRIEAPREEQVTSGFVRTRLYDEIERRCQRALVRNRILFIFGDSQIGKTVSLKEYTRTHNHGETIYVEVPAGGAKGALLAEIARAIGVEPSRKNQRELEQAIIRGFDRNNLLILDEAHRFFEGRSQCAGLGSLSFIRQLYNQAGCGMVLSMTNEGRKEFLTGRHAEALKQMWRRRITPLQLPAVPPDDDAAKFAEAYGLEPARDESVSVKLTIIDPEGRERQTTCTDNPLRLQREVLQKEGLGVWISILQDASDMAKAARRAITWAAVLKAHAQAQAEAEIFQ